MVKVTPSALVHVRVGLVAGLIGNGNNLIPCLILCHSLGIAGIFVQRARNGVIHTGTAVDRDRFRSGSTRKVRAAIPLEYRNVIILIFLLYVPHMIIAVQVCPEQLYET